MCISSGSGSEEPRIVSSGHAELGTSELLGRIIRIESPPSQGTSTFIELACRIKSQAPDARAWIAYLATEISVSFNCYENWIPRISQLLSEEISDRDAADLTQEATNTIIQLDSLDTQVEIDEMWIHLNRLLDELKIGLEEGIEPRQSILTLSSIRDAHERIHDTQVGISCELMGMAAEALSDGLCIGIIRKSLEPWIRERYTPFLVSSEQWGSVADEFLRLVCESMRAHLSGPRRLGEFDVIAHRDWWDLELDTCGSGCQAVRGTTTLPPLVSTERSKYRTLQSIRDVSWYSQNVPLYCVHCSLLGELMPMEKVGVVWRVTMPPRQFGGPIRFRIPRNARAIDERKRWWARHASSAGDQEPGSEA